MASNLITSFTTAHGKLLLAMTLEPREIGQRIAEARKKRGWTQLAFALHANVSPSSVARWEAGRLPPVQELMRLAGLLEIDPGELVEDQLGRDDRGSPENQRLLEEVVALRADVRRMIRLVEALGAGQPPVTPGRRPGP